MKGFTLTQAIKYIEESGKKGWRLKPIEGTDFYELSRILTIEEVHNHYQDNEFE